MQSVGMSVCSPCSLSACLCVHHADYRPVCNLCIYTMQSAFLCVLQSVGLSVCALCTMLTIGLSVCTSTPRSLYPTPTCLLVFLPADHTVGVPTLVCQSICTRGSFEMLICWPVILSPPSLPFCDRKIAFLSGRLIPHCQISCLIALAYLPFVLCRFCLGLSASLPFRLKRACLLSCRLVDLPTS
jgi:hypothetical protein